MAKETFTFQAEVSKLLDIVAHSLYSHKEIFLRELISNASDACDQLRYLSLTEPNLIKSNPEFEITIAADPKARTITVSDNGIGMGHDELTETLGSAWFLKGKVSVDGQVAVRLEFACTAAKPA